MEKELYLESAEIEAKHWWFVGRRAILLDTLMRFSGASHNKLLDIGCGTGLNAMLFSVNGFLVTGLETSAVAIGLARAIAPSINILATSFPSSLVPRDSYAVITALDVIEHIDDDKGMIRAVADALQPGGIVLISVPAFSFLWSVHDELAHHKRRYNREELRASFVMAGLEPIFISYFNFFLFPAIALFRVLSGAFRFSRNVSDFSATPELLNSMLASIFAAERFLLRFFPLPFGVSLIAVARKNRVSI